jgi:hypothetical protein
MVILLANLITFMLAVLFFRGNSTLSSASISVVLGIRTSKDLWTLKNLLDRGMMLWEEKLTQDSKNAAVYGIIFELEPKKVTDSGRTNCRRQRK